MTKAFIIRFHYEKDDPRFEWRYKYFINEVLPRIKAQTEQDFDICIRCNSWHKELFESLGLKTFHVENEVVSYKQGPRLKYFHDFVPFERTVGLDKYDVQMGLDSDDLIEPGYVETLMNAIRKQVKQTPDKTIHVCFQPKTVNIRDGKRIVKPMLKYTPTRGSAFMGLYQPDKGDNYKFVYCESHMTLWKHSDTSIVLPDGYCYATIHDINESTGR